MFISNIRRLTVKAAVFTALNEIKVKISTLLSAEMTRYW